MRKTKPEVFLDHYLSTIGLWRKPIARDGLSLFRAVSEQLFMTQSYHTNLYEACRTVFCHLDKDPDTEWTEYWIMKILSRMYRRDFLVYEAVGEPPVLATFNDFDDKIVLCRVEHHQLDSAYPLSFQNSAAICQSIVYEMLYRGVFKLDSELTEAVSLIRNENKRKMSLLSNTFDDLHDTCIPKLQNLHICFKEGRLRKPSPPLPYRIAKALDPYIYRNVELDIWEEQVREQKKESREYRMRFAVGDKCGVILEGYHYHGHIQELTDQDKSAVVFIEELGEKQTVLISCLKTLSTRFSNNNRHKYIRRKPDYTGRNYHSDYTAQLKHQHKSYIQDGATPNRPVVASGTLSDFSTMTNGNTGYVGMDTSPVQTLDNANKTNINQTSGVAYQQYPQAVTAYPQNTMSGSPYIYSNAVVPQNYSYMVVPHLESIPVQAVNMNCIPSQDMNGKDLPDLNTLRFFYNLGVENYRQISGPRWPSVEMNPVMPPGSMMMADQLNGNVPLQQQPQNMAWSQHESGEHAAITGPIPSSQVYYQCTQSNNAPGILGPYTAPEQSVTAPKCPSSNSAMSSPSKSEAAALTGSSEEMVDSNDSGCDSDSMGSAHGEIDESGPKPTAIALEQKLDNYIANVNTDNDNTSLPAMYQSSSPPKQKSKRKYYMYGNLKLVKPIKDIPPRYLKLLSKLNQEKHRCEGEPIIVPYLPPKSYKYHNRQQNVQHTQINGTNGFNPEAKTFVPNNPVMHDPSIIACGGNVTSGTAMQLVPYQHYQSGVGSSYNGNVIYSHVDNTGDGTQSRHSSSSSSSDKANQGDGSKGSMPFFAGHSSPYPGAVPCPVYFTNPSGPAMGAQTCAPPGQVAAGSYIPTQNASMLPTAMPLHPVQMAQ